MYVYCVYSGTCIYKVVTLGPTFLGCSISYYRGGCIVEVQYILLICTLGPTRWPLYREEAAIQSDPTTEVPLYLVSS